MKLIKTATYRKDIDGLRAIAVLAVIAFHFGLLPNGYLGVDIFFVISGYLITGIIYREMTKSKFSIVDFYLRRIRRILPLTLFLILVTLLIGLFVMLPDDLENLAQSVIATNVFSNNILQAITTKNYWDIVNEYKPLMHTWSLGVEEQYYFVYPIFLLLIGKKNSHKLLPTLSILALLSLIFYFLPFKEHEKFYYLPFRFFELACGGIAALYLKDKVIRHQYTSIILLSLLVILFIGNNYLGEGILLPLSVILSVGIVSSANDQNWFSNLILQNKLSVMIGLISFSLYMWHQPVLAYTKYAVAQYPTPTHMLAMFMLIVLLSVFSYFAVERPFRNKTKIKTISLLTILAALFTITTFPSLYIYWKAGVIRDIPELGIKKSEAVRGLHGKYNDRVFVYDKPFDNDNSKIKVLVLGNSFARDWVNVLLESNYSNVLDISYIYNPFKRNDLKDRAEAAQVIFYSTATRTDVDELGIDKQKLFVIGTKNFGGHSGYFYNYSGKDYFEQRTLMENGYLDKNAALRTQWGDRYIDLIAKVIDAEKKVPVFTDNNMFISQDCRHFTKAGAAYFAKLFESEIGIIVENISSEIKHRAT